ncbi:MAG: PLP-dependent transferase [Gammaproteobacteria bacterium]|nr:PLP-dependent transferase [Gammaproteobacteria bacterium]
MSRLEDHHVPDHEGGVNPAISDSSTFAFSRPDLLRAAFHDEAPGCYLYSRAGNATLRTLADAMAALEGSEAAHVTASGMSAIAITLMQLAASGSRIVASHTVYGGTWALLGNLLPRFGVETRFADTNDLEEVREAVNGDTAAIYCETLSNPMLRMPAIGALAQIARESDAALVVDNTFAPLLVSPIALGADVVVHSLTKFINGASDCIAGAVCASDEFIATLGDVNAGTAMLIGPVLDSLRAQSIYKNLATLDVRMQRHGENAAFLAERLEEAGLETVYPGLASHPEHDLFDSQANPGYGYGGMLGLDLGTVEAAEDLAMRLQDAGVGLLAVSLGHARTLFSPSGSSTSSEIPPEMQNQIGLSPGLLRFSIGLDADIEATWERFSDCLADANLV